jgi:hypothetical protein
VDRRRQYVCRRFKFNISFVNAYSISSSSWRNWSWSQLEQPRFPVGDGNCNDNVDEDLLDPFDSLNYHLL